MSTKGKPEESREDGKKGKKCPGGYWIPQKYRCGGKKRPKISRTTGAALLGVAAVGGVAAAVGLGGGSGGGRKTKSTTPGGGKKESPRAGNSSREKVNARGNASGERVSPPGTTGAGNTPGERARPKGNPGEDFRKKFEKMAIGVYTETIEKERQRFADEYREKAVNFLRDRLGHPKDASYPAEEVDKVLSDENLISNLRFGRPPSNPGFAATREQGRTEAFLSLIRKNVKKAGGSLGGFDVERATKGLDMEMSRYIKAMGEKQPALLILEGELARDGSSGPAGEFSARVRDSFFRMGGKSYEPARLQKKEGESEMAYLDRTLRSEDMGRVGTSTILNLHSFGFRGNGPLPTMEDYMRAASPESDYMKTRMDPLKVARDRFKRAEAAYDNFKSKTREKAREASKGFSSEQGGAAPPSREEGGMGDLKKEFGIDENSSAEDIRRVKRQVAKMYHPDVNPSQTPEEIEKFKRLNSLISELQRKGDSLFFDLYPRWDSKACKFG